MDLLISIVVIAIVFGFIYWVVGQLPIPQPWKKIALVAVLILALLYLLNALQVLNLGLPLLR